MFFSSVTRRETAGFQSACVWACVCVHSVARCVFSHSTYDLISRAFVSRNLRASARAVAAWPWFPHSHTRSLYFLTDTEWQSGIEEAFASLLVTERDLHFQTVFFFFFQILIAIVRKTSSPQGISRVTLVKFCSVNEALNVCYAQSVNGATFFLKLQREKHLLYRLICGNISTLFHCWWTMNYTEFQEKRKQMYANVQGFVLYKSCKAIVKQRRKNVS